MEKVLKFEQVKKDLTKFEMWKLNPRGYFNFIAFCDFSQIAKMQKKYKGYKIITKMVVVR